MYIKSIFWIEEDDKEAEVIVSDGHNEFLCFCDDLQYDRGDALLDPLSCLDISEVQVSDSSSCSITKLPSHFAYKVTGKIQDLTNRVVLVGKIKISLEDCPLPKDLNQNDYIVFSVSRLDIF